MDQTPSDPRASFVLSRQHTPAKLPVSNRRTWTKSPEPRDVGLNYVYPHPRTALEAPQSPYFRSVSLPSPSKSPFMAMTGNEDVQIINGYSPTQSPPVTHPLPELDPVPPQDTPNQSPIEPSDLNPQDIRCVRCRKFRGVDGFPILTRGPDKGQRAKTCEFCKTSGSNYNKRRRGLRQAAAE